MENERLSSYPKPEGETWADAYRYAYAKDEVFTKLFVAIKNWAKEYDEIVKKESTPDPDIVEA